MRSAVIALDHYRFAKEALMASRWADEIFAMARIDLEAVSEPLFLRETAWVILNSGFRESVIRGRFDYLSMCYHDWECAEAIVRDAEQCVRTARAAFAHQGKLRAIALCAELVTREGFSDFWMSVRRHPIAALQQLPYVGPITVWHLAKNLGFRVAKPDRHLQRLALRFGYSDTHHLCADLSDQTGDTPDVVDSVLWRFESERMAAGAMAA